MNIPHVIHIIHMNKYFLIIFINIAFPFTRNWFICFA